jgi:hypothetical protein
VKNDELSYNLGDTVDRLISVQYFMSGGGSALTRKPVTGVLYEAAREKAGAPLCHLAAKALADNVNRGDTVLITTGLIAPPYMIAEGDGPIAAATHADFCVFGSKSNYGGFAIEACLAAGLELPEILHSEVVGRRVHEAGAAMGLVDPFTGLAFGWDDFPVDKNVNELVVNLIRYMLAVRVVPRWYKDSIMGPSQKWIHERSFAEDLVTRWAKSITASEKELFSR